MNVWWCNQTGSWKDESNAGVVCSSTATARPKFREMVSRARPRDIILHYRSGKGIYAVSRASANPVRCKQNDSRAICLHGKGWSFPTKYHFLKPAIPRNAFLKPLLSLQIEDGPVLRCRTGRLQIRQEYFMPFSSMGLQVVYRAGREQEWPPWVITYLRRRPSAPGQRRVRKAAATLNAVEGLLTETRVLLRSRNRRLREHVMKRAAGVCSVCRRNFSVLLKGAGRRALHVHHIRQLSASDKPRETSEKDLVVVCATCHALIHSDPKRVLQVDPLRRALKKEGYLTS